MINPVAIVGRPIGRGLDVAASGVRWTAQFVGNPIRTRVPHFSKSYGGWGFLGGTNFDYAGAVGRTAHQNSAVVAVVGWIARNFPEAPVRIVRLNASPAQTGDAYIPSSATGLGAMLRLLEHPNNWYSGVLQWMATLVDWCFTGNAYWIKVRNPNTGRVEQVWWAPSWMMEPRWDPDRDDQFIGWYEYSVEGNLYGYRPEDVVHFRDGIDPYNTRKGLSRLGSLMREIYTDDEASNMTASLMRNLGVPGVVISPANTTGPMGRIADPEQVKDTFMEKFSGDKRGEPMVMSTPTEIKVLSWSPQQMDLRSLRKIPEERISAVYGVAAIVAGLGAGLDRSTFNNFEEARKAAYTEAIIPAQRLFAAELEVQLLPEYGNTDGTDVFFDWKMATAMQENAGDVWKRYSDAAVKGLLTRGAFKRAVGEPLQADDDVYIIPNNYLLLGPSQRPPLPQPPAPPRLNPGEPPPRQLPERIERDAMLVEATNHSGNGHVGSAR